MSKITGNSTVFNQKSHHKSSLEDGVVTITSDSTVTYSNENWREFAQNFSLCLSKMIVEMHGGNMWLKATPEKAALLHLPYH